MTDEARRQPEVAGDPCCSPRVDQIQRCGPIFPCKTFELRIESGDDCIAPCVGGCRIHRECELRVAREDGGQHPMPLDLAAQQLPTQHHIAVELLDLLAQFKSAADGPTAGGRQCDGREDGGDQPGSGVFSQHAVTLRPAG